MFKDGRYINAGTNEYYRWGHKAEEKVRAAMTPNEAGFYGIAADGGNYWTFGTSVGKYGEYAKWNDTFFSVNRAGKLWAKAGTEKGEKFVEMLQSMLDVMAAKRKFESRGNDEDEETA